MQGKLYRGIVKRFNSERLFGHVTVLDDDGNKTRRDVFFHIDDGRTVTQNGSGPTFAPKPGRRDPKPQRPQRGDMLVFRIERTPRGNRAEPWCHADGWDEALAHS